MNVQSETNEILVNKLTQLQTEYDALRELYQKCFEENKRFAGLKLIADRDKVFHNEERKKHVAEFIQISEDLDSSKKTNAFYVARELKMIELKREVNELLVQAGGEKKYIIFN